MTREEMGRAAELICKKAAYATMKLVKDMERTGLHVSKSGRIAIYHRHKSQLLGL